VLAAARKSSSLKLETSIDVGHMRQLRKVLAGSRYQLVNYRSLGYELIVADASATWVGPRSEAPADRQRMRERIERAFPEVEP